MSEDWRKPRVISRAEMMTRVARFKDVKGSSGGLPDSYIPGCYRTLCNVIGFQPPESDDASVVSPVGKDASAQAAINIAEGFNLFDACEYQLENAKIAHLWGQGSVVRSWLCELAARAFEADGNDLEAIEGYTEDSGEGRWTIADATAHDVPTPVITASLYARMRSRGNGEFADRVLAALRNQFGGHAVKPPPGKESSR